MGHKTDLFAHSRLSIAKHKEQNSNIENEITLKIVWGLFS